MGRRTGGLVCGAQGERKGGEGEAWRAGGDRSGTALLGPLPRSRDNAGLREWRGEPCLVGKVGRSADLGHTGCLVPGAGAQNQGRWQVRTTEATGQGHSLVSGSAGPTWWPGRQGDSSEGDSSAASPRQVLTFWPQSKDRHGGTAYTRTRQDKIHIYKGQVLGRNPCV